MGWLYHWKNFILKTNTFFLDAIDLLADESLHFSFPKNSRFAVSTLHTTLHSTVKKQQCQLIVEETLGFYYVEDIFPVDFLATNMIFS